MGCDNVDSEINKIQEWTNSTRPASPYNGQTGYNTDIQQWEGWNGSAWVVVG